MGYIYEIPLYTYSDYKNKNTTNPVGYLPCVRVKELVDVQYYKNTSLLPYIWRPDTEAGRQFDNASDGFPKVEYLRSLKEINNLVKAIKTYGKFTLRGIDVEALFTEAGTMVYQVEDGVLWISSKLESPPTLPVNFSGVMLKTVETSNYAKRDGYILTYNFSWIQPIYNPTIQNIIDQYNIPVTTDSIMNFLEDETIDATARQALSYAIKQEYFRSGKGISPLQNAIYYVNRNPNQYANLYKGSDPASGLVTVQYISLPAIDDSSVGYLEGNSYGTRSLWHLSEAVELRLVGYATTDIIGNRVQIRRPYIGRLQIASGVRYSNIFSGGAVKEPTIGKYVEDGYPNGGNDDGVQQKDGTSGNGDYDNTTDPIEFPTVPMKTASLSGMVSLWNPEINEISQLNSYLWSPEVVDIMKKFWNDPMDGIISLSLVPIDVGATEYREIRIGGNYTGIRMKRIFNQIQKVNMGKLKFAEYFGSFADYSPYTIVYIYLPYIGMTQLNVDDIMDCDLELEYMIDLFDGTTVANLRSVRVWDGLAGIVGSWAGNCQTQIPVSSVSYREMLAGAARAGIGMLTGSMVAGAALGAHPQPQWKNNPFYVPETGEFMSYRTLEGDNTNVLNERAMGGSLQMQGVQGMNMGLNAKGQVSRGGNANCTAGALSVQTPYLIINRPVSAMPDGINDFIGYPSYSRGRLGDQQGFTQVLYVKLENLTATQKERAELDQILKGGVIF